MITFENFHEFGRWPSLCEALKICKRCDRMFGGQSLSILLVKVSIPGAPFELHEDKANIISLRVMSGSLGIFWSVESGGSGISNLLGH